MFTPFARVSTPLFRAKTPGDPEGDLMDAHTTFAYCALLRGLEVKTEEARACTCFHFSFPRAQDNRFGGGRSRIIQILQVTRWGT